ncbi:restriction endonuclease subunit S [Thiolapillus sp.]|uniref:restriction endonuclease subunit S n=6 Tax=Thiolapillus sp. TaxID=2017437 RepID=UPI003AF61B72
MSSKSDKKKPLVPSLRFPEFREAGAWEVKRLGDIASIIQDKVGRKECILLSVTSGIGLVSQVEKFGREIASNQRKNYFAIRSNDFAYNKSATKNYPQGFIGLYKGDKLAGVPNSIFICFRPNLDEVVPSYLDYLFSANLHGKQLNRFITVGARAHGSLNVDNKDLLSIPIPIPMNDEENGQVEQQKIAHCLSSLDEVMGLQAKKVQALKQHKKGLMQQLFPAEGETTPRLRFPEFREAGAWEVKRLGEVCDSFSGGTPTTTKKQYYGGSIPFIRSAEIADEITELFLTDEGVKASSAKIVSKGDVLVALYGANSGDVALSKISGAINQAILCLRLSVSNEFIYHYLTHKKGLIIATYIQGGQGNLSGEIVCSISIGFPDNEEQQKIAHCLSSLDEVIGLESHKLDALKNLKKGLMQQLFPQDVA